MGSCLSQEHEIKCKQPHKGFEFNFPIPFLMRMIPLNTSKSFSKNFISFNQVLFIRRKIRRILKLIDHHRVVPLAQISLILPRHFSLSFIASGRSSGLHPVSSHSCCIFELVILPLLGHMWESIVVHHLWALLLPGLIQYCSQHSCVIAV